LWNLLYGGLSQYGLKNWSAQRIKSDTSGKVEYTKAIEEYNWRNSANWLCNIWI